MNKTAYIEGYAYKTAGVTDYLANKLYGGKTEDVKGKALDAILKRVRGPKVYGEMPSAKSKAPGIQ